MEGMRPLVHAAINGQDALFVADSGAFYSSLTPAAARQFNLRLEPTNVRFNLVGVGAVGLLGQNVFRLGDVEYDLANGTIAILRTHGECRKTSLAYWANGKGIPW